MWVSCPHTKKLIHTCQGTIIYCFVIYHLTLTGCDTIQSAMIERRTISQEEFDLEIPDFTFRPNIWTEAFLTGLSTIDVQGAKVAELGVGTGIVGIDLLRRGVGHYVGIDIDDRILPVALRNITHAVPGQTSRITLLTSDLLDKLDEDHSFNIICGCLPQVSKPPTITLGSADSFARYFDSQKYQSDLNVYGLGLNESALIQARTRLRPDGRAVLVLSGRAGNDVINRMFERNGYSARVLFEDTITQLKETTLSTLVGYEALGHEFFFYEDDHCEKRITVAEAEQRRLQGEDLWHKIYVVEGTIAA